MFSIKKSCLGLTALLAASGISSSMTPPAMADTTVSLGVQIGMAWSDVGSTVGLIFVVPPPPVASQPYYVIYQPTYYYYHPTYRNYRYTWWHNHYPRGYTVINRTYYPSSYYRSYGVPSRVERTHYPSGNRTYSGVNRSYPNGSSRGNSTATTNTSNNSAITGNANTVSNTVNNTTNIYGGSNSNANNRRSDRRYDSYRSGDVNRTPSTNIEVGSGNSSGSNSERRRWRYGTGAPVSNPKPSTPPAVQAPTPSAPPSTAPVLSPTSPTPSRSSSSGNPYRGSYGTPSNTVRSTPAVTIDSGSRSGSSNSGASNSGRRRYR